MKILALLAAVTLLGFTEAVKLKKYPTYFSNNEVWDYDVVI